MTVLKGEGKVPILFGTTSVATGAKTLDTYLARPDLTGEWPTVVVLPSEWGMTSSVKDLARRVARHGVAAIVVDYYRGDSPPRSADRETVAVAMAEVPGARVRRLLDVVIDFIQNPAGFWSNAEDGLAVLGIGGGGPFAVEAARASDAALILAGSPLTADRLARVTGPILGLYGRDDPLVPVDDIMAARARVPHAEWVLYENVGHDFLDDYLDDFDSEAHKDAVQRIAEFCEKHLPKVRA